jgi:hypothetical protein
MVGAQAWRSGPTPTARGPFGHGHRHTDIRVVEFTPSSDSDTPCLPELLSQLLEGAEIGTATADGAFETRRCNTAIIDRQATALIPIPKNRRPRKWEPGRYRPNRNPQCRTTLWPRVPEAMDRLPCPQPDRGEDALSQGLR